MKGSKFKISKKDLLKMIKNSLFVILGTFILAFGTEVFIAQSQLVTGGMSGVAIILQAIIGADKCSFETIISIETWAFFLLGFIILGRDFAIKTLISTLFYPLFIYLFSFLVNSNFLYIETFYNSSFKDLLSSLFGGALIGCGVALSFLGGGSTGGTDIIALILRKFIKIKESTMIFIIDGLIVLIALFVLKDFELTLLGVLSAFISSLFTDKIFIGRDRAYIAEVVSDKYEEITEDVINLLERTTTVLDVTGGYSKHGLKMLLISFKMDEYSKLMAIIKNRDPRAFTLIHQAHEIKGEGWTYDSNEKELYENEK